MLNIHDVCQKIVSSGTCIRACKLSTSIHEATGRVNIHVHATLVARLDPFDLVPSLDLDPLEYTRPDFHVLYTRSTEKLGGVKFSKVYMDVYMKIYTSKFTRSTEKLRGVYFSKVYMDVYMEISTSKFTPSTRDALTRATKPRLDQHRSLEEQQLSPNFPCRRTNHP